MIKSSKNGFSLIEMLVVISVLAMIITASLMSFVRLRAMARDSIRLTHITQLQTALRAYYRDWGVYPASLAAGQSLASSTTTYLQEVPTMPKPIDGNCAATSTYEYYQDNSGASYHIVFCLGDQTSDVPKGLNTATPNGIKN
jgi:prepilin-type N-terminal cleavage/methylation domain-containing protein